MAHQKIQMGLIEESFAANVRAIRSARGIDYRDILRVLAGRGVSMKRDALYRIELGERHPTLDEAVGISVALDVPLVHLLQPGYLTIVPRRTARWARTPRGGMVAPL